LEKLFAQNTMYEWPVGLFNNMCRTETWYWVFLGSIQTTGQYSRHAELDLIKIRVMERDRFFSVNDL